MLQKFSSYEIGDVEDMRRCAITPNELVVLRAPKASQMFPPFPAHSRLQVSYQS